MKLSYFSFFFPILSFLLFVGRLATGVITFTFFFWPGGDPREKRKEVKERSPSVISLPRKGIGGGVSLSAASKLAVKKESGQIFFFSSSSSFSTSLSLFLFIRRPRSAVGLILQENVHERERSNPRLICAQLCRIIVVSLFNISAPCAVSFRFFPFCLLYDNKNTGV